MLKGMFDGANLCRVRFGHMTATPTRARRLIRIYVTINNLILYKSLSRQRGPSNPGRDAGQHPVGDLVQQLYSS